MTKEKSEPRRILISGGLVVGGPQTHVTVLCEILIRAGAEVTIAAASTNWPKEAIENIKSIGVRVNVSPFHFGAFGKAFAFLAWPFLLRRDYDVVYCIGEGKMHLWTILFARKGGRKIYHEIVDCPVPKSVAAKVAAKMDFIVANSRAVRAKMSEINEYVPVRVIPFLTARRAINPPVRRSAIAERELRVAFLGRLVPHKQPHRLIEAWPTWNGCSPIGPARLDLYGGDYDQEAAKLQHQIGKLGLSHCVKVHGPYNPSDLSKILEATDLVVLPSLYEGLPLVLVEAMQRGIPVVATSAGGTMELGENNPDVVITEGTDWEGFSTGLKSMATMLRSDQINRHRLYEWTETRYGFTSVSVAWREALLSAEAFFSEEGESIRISK